MKQQETTTPAEPVTEEASPPPRTIFVHGPYTSWTDKVMTPEEAMKIPRSPFVPPLELTPLGEFLELLSKMSAPEKTKRQP